MRDRNRDRDRKVGAEKAPRWSRRGFLQPGQRAAARLDAARNETLLARKAEILERAGDAAQAAHVREAALVEISALPPAKRRVPAMRRLEQRLRARRR